MRQSSPAAAPAAVRAAGAAKSSTGSKLHSAGAGWPERAHSDDARPLLGTGLNRQWLHSSEDQVCLRAAARNARMRGPTLRLFGFPVDLVVVVVVVVYTIL